MDAAAFRAPRIPIRTPPVAATDHGRRARERAAGRRATRSALWHRDPARTAAIRKYRPATPAPRAYRLRVGVPAKNDAASADQLRSEEHTSELQSLRHLVCRLLLEKK